MEAYFDNAATTRVFDQVKDIMVKTMTEDYGNAASRHKKGMEAEQYVREARGIIAKSLRVQEKEIVFTSGGTESNNMALIGGAMASRRRGRHIISVHVEHPSVYNTLEFLKDQGFEVTYLPVDSYGCISMAQLKESLRPETVLVSVMHVNNEIGSVEPVEEIAKAVKEAQPEALFHVDAVQAYGKYEIRPRRQGIDLLSVSGHKFHGPKGTGFLYISEKARVKPIIYGGGQQRGMRSGTENVPGAAGLGAAAKEMYENHREKVDYLYGLKDHFMERMREVEGCVVNSRPGRESAPQIVSVSFEGIRSEALLHALEERGIYVSSGSACSSAHPETSRTLKGIGVKENLLDATLRFSFGMFNKKEEIDYAIQALQEILPVLRKFRRG